MSSPVVGTARIEVLGDTTALATEMDADLQAAAGKLAAEFGKVFGPAMEEEMAAAGAVSGEVFYKGIDGKLRTAEGKFVSRGRAAAAGYTDAVVAGMATGTPKVAEAGAVQGRAAAKATAAQGTAAGKGFAARVKETLLGSHMITGAIFAGIGYEAVKMAGDFQTGMVRLVTAAGETKANLASVSAGVLDISRQTGVSTHQLADGMYMVESAGFHGKAGLAVMKAAAQGAKVDMADANVVANALTTALTDMGKASGTPAEMMSKLVATVGHGKMTMDELASSIHSVLPNAAAIGLSFAQTAGAIATMTAQGISAQQATQNLNHAILSLANPTAVQTKAMAAFGLNASNVAKNLGKVGLTGTLDELQRTILGHMGPAGLTLTKALNSSEIAGGKVKTMLGSLPSDVKKLADQMMGGEISAAKYTRAVNKLTADHSVLGRQFLATYNRAHGFADILKQASPDAMTFSAAMAKMTGGQVGLQVALHLTGENMHTYRANVKAINAAHAEAGGNVEGWAEKQKTFNQVMSQVTATIKAAMIVIGTKLLPVVTELGNVMLRDVFPAIKWTVDAIGAMYRIVRDNSGLMLLVTMVGAAAAAFTAWKIAVGTWSLVTKAAIAVQEAFNAATAANPIMLAVMAIAALAAGAIYAYQHFKPFRDVVDAVGRALRTGFMAALHAVEAAIRYTVDFVRDHWKLIAVAITVALGPIAVAVALIGGAIFLLVRHFRDIARVAQEVWSAVTGWFRRMANDVTGFATGIWHAVRDAWNKVLSVTAAVLDSVGAYIHRHWRLLLTIVTAGAGLIYVIIQDHWHTIAGVFTRLYNDVAGVVSRLWHTVVGFWNRIYGDVAGVVTRLWRQVTGVWNRVYGDVAGVVTRIWRSVAAVFARIYNDVASVVTALWRLEVTIWTRIYNTVTGIGSRLWHAVAGFFTRIGADVAGATSVMWARLGALWSRGFTDVSGVASRIWHGVVGFFTSMRDDVTARFTQMTNGIKLAWDKVKNIVAAPIRWVVDTVYDQGIVPIWNAVAGVLHEPGMKLQPVHFARGGVVPGDRRDGDNVPIYATAGEVVVPLDRVAAHGGPDSLMAKLGFGPRSGGSGDHFIWGGGVVGDIGSGIAGGAKAVGGAAKGAASAVGHAAGSIAGDLAHLARGVLAAGLAPAVHRIESMADSYLNPLGGVGHLMDMGVHNIGDRVLNWARGDDKKLVASVAGSAGGAARWAPIVSQVLAMLGIPGSALNGILSLINMESGGNPTAVNRTDSNALAGHPSMGLMQCVSLATTILTKRGWLRYDQVKVGDETIGYNPATGMSEWTTITKVVQYDDEVVWRIGHKRWHADVTPNHRWFSDTVREVATIDGLTCTDCGYEATTAKGIATHRGRAHKAPRAARQNVYQGEFIRTEDFQSRHRIRLAAPAQTDGTLPISDSEAAILGWLHGDGHIRKVAAKPSTCPECGWSSLAAEQHQRNAVAVHRSKVHGITKAVTESTEAGGWDATVYQAKPERVATLRALLAGTPHTERGRDRRAAHHMDPFTFSLRRQYATSLMERSGLETLTPEDFVLRLSTSQRRAWLGAIIEAEGHRQPGKLDGHSDFVRIAQIDGPMQDAIKLAVYLEGWRPTYSANSAERNGYQPAGTIGMAKPHVAPSTFLPHQVLERQPVWCVKTDLETWTANLDGQVFLTGNTIPSTFAAYAGPYASRGITDPLANIYAGVNYALHRYGAGMLAAGGNHDAAGNYVGYDSGGILKPGQVGKNYGTSPERVLTPAQTRSFDALVKLLGSGAFPLSLPGHFTAGEGKISAFQKALFSLTDHLRAAAKKDQSKVVSLGRGTGTAAERNRLLVDERALNGAAAHNDRLNDFITKENGLLQKVSAMRTNTAAKLAAANQRLADAITNRTNYSNTVRGNAMGYGAITTTNMTALYSGSIIGNMKDRLARLVAYRAGLRKLAGMGLNAQSYQELVDAGPDQGQYFVTALLNGGKGDLAKVNTLQHGIAAASTGLGKDTAGHLYNAGVNAAQGLVNGLKGGEKAIAAQMVRIGKLISATIRRELKIHSPSQLMHDHGINVPLGLAGGIDAGAHHVESAAIRMVKPLRQPDLAAMAHTQAVNGLTAVLARQGARSGPLVHVERVDSGVDLELFARQAEFRERAGAFE